MIVAMTAWKRPYYLSRVIESLHEANWNIEEPVFLVVRIEPSDKADRMLDIVGNGKRGVYAEVNETLLTCCWNTRAVLDDAWDVADRFDEDFVLLLEEDFVVSPDALDLTVWMRERYRASKEIIATGLFNRGTYFKGIEKQVARDGNFVGQGWGTWRDRWDYIRPQWHDRKFEDRGPTPTPGMGYYLGWDVNFDQNIMQGRLQVRPLLSRVLHIGEEDGQHTTPNLYPKTLPLAFSGDSRLPGVESIWPGEGGGWYE